MRTLKVFLSLFVLMAILGTAQSPAQLTATSTVTNFSVSGGIYSFDVFAVRTGTNSIRVGTSNFIVNTNRAGLSPIGMFLTNVNTKYTLPGTTNGDYALMRVDTIVGSAFAGKVAVTIAFTGNGDFGAGQLLSNATPPGERICTINLPIVNPTLTANLTWDVINSAITDSRSQPVTNNFVGSDNSILPVQLVSFTGTLQPNGVRLQWRTASEINNYGFYAQRKRQGESSFTEIPNSFVAGHGTTNEPHSYHSLDPAVTSGSWLYRLRQVDLDGAEHFTEPINVTTLTGVKEVAPLEFALKQNYPNPFNPETNIKFSVETTDRATVEMYNALGQRVATLFNDVAEAGYYYTIKFSGQDFASGVYFYRLQSGIKSDLKKLLLLK